MRARRKARQALSVGGDQAEAGHAFGFDGLHVAVMPLRVADRFRDLLAVHPLPFDLQGYRPVVCWNLRSNSDAGVLWLKDALLRIGRGSEAASTTPLSPP